MPPCQALKIHQDKFKSSWPEEEGEKVLLLTLDLYRQFRVVWLCKMFEVNHFYFILIYFRLLKNACQHFLKKLISAYVQLTPTTVTQGGQ